MHWMIKLLLFLKNEDKTKIRKILRIAQPKIYFGKKGKWN